MLANPLPGGHSSVRAAAPSVIDGCPSVDGVPMDEHDRCLAQALAATARCDDLHEHAGVARISRRGLLRGAGLAGAGAAAYGLLPGAPALAAEPAADARTAVRWR